MALYDFINYYSHPSTGIDLQQSTTNLNPTTGIPETLKGLRFMIQPLANDCPALLGSRGSGIGFDNGGPNNTGIKVCLNGSTNCHGPYTYDQLVNTVTAGSNTITMLPNNNKLRGHQAGQVTNMGNAYYINDHWGMRNPTSYAEFINMTSTKPMLQEYSTAKGGYHGLCWGPQDCGGCCGWSGIGMNSSGYTCGHQSGSQVMMMDGNVPPFGQYQHYIMIDYSNDDQVRDPGDWKFFLQNIYGAKTHQSRQALAGLVNYFRGQSGQSTFTSLGDFPPINSGDEGMLDHYIEIVPMYDYNDTAQLNPALGNFDFRREDNGNAEVNYSTPEDRFDHFVTDNNVSEVDELVKMVWKRIETADPRFTSMTMTEKKKRLWITKEPLPMQGDYIINGLNGGNEWRRPVPYHYWAGHFDGTVGRDATGNLIDYGLTSYDVGDLNTFWGGEKGFFFGTLENQGSMSFEGLDKVMYPVDINHYYNPQWNLVVTNGTQTHHFGNARPDLSSVGGYIQNEVDRGSSMGEGVIQINNTSSNYYHSPIWAAGKTGPQ